MAPIAQTSDLKVVNFDVNYSGDAKLGDIPIYVFKVVCSIERLLPKSHTCTVGLLYLINNLYYNLKCIYKNYIFAF